MSNQVAPLAQSQSADARFCTIFEKKDAVSDVSVGNTETCAMQSPLQNAENRAIHASLNAIAAQPIAENPQALPQELTPKQVQALELLAAGRRHKEIAKSLEIDPSTLFRWKSQNPAFMAAMNDHHKDALSTLSTQVLNTLQGAIKILNREMSRRYSDDRMRAALAILSAFGTKKLLTPSGPAVAATIVGNLVQAAEMQNLENLVPEGPVKPQA